MTETIDRVGSGQTRARYPDAAGYVERDGVRTHYEVFGSGEPTVLLLPTWSIVHSLTWKMQVPYLARHCRVITFDGRGNGLSDRPEEPEAYGEEEFAADALAVLDATETSRAFVVGFSMGAQRALLLAANHPERVEGLVFIGPAVALGPQSMRAKALADFSVERDSYEGWSKYNRNHWLNDYADFLRFFFAERVHRAALDEADRGLRRLGARDDPRDLDRDAARAADAGHGGARARGPRAVPGARDPRHGGRDSRARLRGGARRADAAARSRASKARGTRRTRAIPCG